MFLSNILENTSDSSIRRFLMVFKYWRTHFEFSILWTNALFIFWLFFGHYVFNTDWTWTFEKPQMLNTNTNYIAKKSKETWLKNFFYMYVCLYVCILFRSLKLALLWMRNVRVEITILIICMLEMVTQVVVISMINQLHLWTHIYFNFSLHLSMFSCFW